ncbi:PTS sugar transporter subunit IIA [Curtobacterium citreum]
MLTELLTEDRILFADHVPTWQEAIDRVTRPLVRDGAITDEYVAAIKTAVESPGGTYIDLGFGIALAHARPEQGVLSPAVSYLRVRPSVELGDDPAHPIDVFLCLAATDSSEHMQTMQQLAELLSDEGLRSQLLTATTTADVTSVINQIGQPA